MLQKIRKWNFRVSLARQKPHNSSKTASFVPPAFPLRPRDDGGLGDSRRLHGQGPVLSEAQEGVLLQCKAESTEFKQSINKSTKDVAKKAQ